MKRKITVVIIEDEPYSRAELIHLLSLEETIHIIGEAGTGEKGLELIICYEPDVVFVDIQMPQMTGIQLVEICQKMKKRPLVVFATAYPDFAAKAFRLQATDYLLKPFDEEQLKETLRRIYRLLSSNEEQVVGEIKLGKFAVEDNGKIIYLIPTDIYYISREAKDTIIAAKTGKYMCKLSLKEVEQKLKGYPFFRTHKSFLVNLTEIEELIPWFSGAFQVKIAGGTEKIPVSRNYVKALRERLEL